MPLGTSIGLGEWLSSEFLRGVNGVSCKLTAAIGPRVEFEFDLSLVPGGKFAGLRKRKPGPDVRVQVSAESWIWFSESWL